MTYVRYTVYDTRLRQARRTRTLVFFLIYPFLVPPHTRDHDLCLLYTYTHCIRFNVLGRVAHNSRELYFFFEW